MRQRRASSTRPVRGASRRTCMAAVAAAVSTVCVAALLLLGLIVVTGAAVRLTGSGLGCDDWPRCNSTKFVDVSIGARGHRADQPVVHRAGVGRRHRRRPRLAASANPRRRDLTLVVARPGRRCAGPDRAGRNHGAGRPAPCGGAGASAAVDGAGRQRGGAGARVPACRPSQRRHRVGRSLRRHVWVCAAATMVAIVFGTVVTGAGPHAGDEDARRFGVSIARAAQVHSVSVWLAVGSIVALMFRLRHRAAERAVLDGPLVAWICVARRAGVGRLPAVLQRRAGGAGRGARRRRHGAVGGHGGLWSRRSSIAGRSTRSAGQALDERGALVDDHREERHRPRRRSR